MNTRTNLLAEGFTLIEVAVVLLIASVALSITVIAFSSYSEQAASRGAAQTFAADLRQARSFSLRARTAVSFEFNEDSALYRVVAETGDTLGVRHFNDLGEFRIDSLDLDVGGDSLRFESDGAMDFSSLRIRTSSGSADFFAGGTQYRVEFNSTGSATITVR